MNRFSAFAIGTALTLGGTLNAVAANYTEIANGDLSNDRLNRTALTLAAGSNRVRGAFGQPDLDYLTLTVPSQHVLAAIRVGEENFPGSTRSFIAVQAGTQMTVPSNTPSPAGLLGYTHVDAGAGAEILAAIGTGFGATGFIPPLAAGTYTFWIQDTSSAVPGMGFDFDFQVQTAPVVSAQKVPMFPWFAVLASAVACATIAHRKNILASPVTRLQ
jgi:hypothetical protein